MEISFWDSIVKYWVPIASCSVVLIAFFTGLGIKWKKKLVEEVKIKMQSEEDKVMANHMEELEEYHKEVRDVVDAIEKSERNYRVRKKFVDDRHKEDKDINDKEHSDISLRLDMLRETARLNVKSNSIILRVLLPMANGSSSDVRKMADEIDAHLRSKV